MLEEEVSRVGQISDSPAAPARTTQEAVCSRRRLPPGTWFPPTVILAAFVSLTIWSWRKWPDISVDFGMQLYTPWQLASGKILYRDLAYLAGGPFSQYLNALAFSLFGISLTVLVILNLCLLLFFTALLYRLFRSAADDWTATAICLVTLCVFSFAQYVRTGNYNYVCPYMYEAFHGLVMAVGAIACLTRWVRSRASAWAFAAGLLCGAVSLTKPDLHLAVLAALAVSIGLYWLTPAFRLRDCGRSIACLFVGHMLPPALVVICYWPVSGFRGGLRAAVATWLPVLTTAVPQNPFYRWGLGLDRPFQNFSLIVEYFLGACLVIAFLAVCSRYFPPRRVWTTILLGAPLLSLIYVAVYGFRWELCGRPLAPLVVLSGGLIASTWWRARFSAAGQALIMPLLWSVFALVLLSKTGLNTRIWHYGFYLAMPAAACIVFGLLWMLPHSLKKLSVDPFIFRLLVTIFLTIGVTQLLRYSDRYYGVKDFSVGAAGDRIVTYNPRLWPEGEGIRQTVEWLLQNTSPSSTVAALPNGMMINYLTRRSNPTAYPALSPPEFITHGEPKLLAAYVRGRPDYIVLIHTSNREYGIGYFGQEPGFGRDMMRWIRSNYTPVWLYGYEPLQTGRFGIRILARADLARRIGK